MKKVLLSMAVVTALAGFTMNASAINKNIELTAEVDAEVDLVQGDGSSLPTALQLQYSPGSGLQTYSLPVKFLSNDATNDLHLYLAAPVKLTDQSNSSNVHNMTVRYDNVALTTSPKVFTAASLFPDGRPASAGSIIQNLDIVQTTRAVMASGSYSGTVQLIVSQVP